MLLKTINLGHSFEYKLYSDINLELDAKQSIAILGVSGSGKSSILNNLSTLLPPKEGRVFVLDQDIYALDNSKMLELRRKEIGIIFQSHYLFRGFNGFENLEVVSLLADTKIDYDLLDKFQIKHVINQQIGELSGGQQQRLSIARVLTKKPKIIFADEPTGNLDKNTAISVMEVIFDYIEQNDGGLILATHDEKLANRCQSVYRLDNKILDRIK